MNGLFIPGITAEMFRNGCLESIDALMADGELYDINYSLWIPFSKELPPKGKKVHVSVFGIVTIGERTSEANVALRLSILDPMNNIYKNINPCAYMITHWQPLPEGYKQEGDK